MPNNKPLFLFRETGVYYVLYPMPPQRFELWTTHLRGGCSNQLSYEGIFPTVGIIPFSSTGFKPPITSLFSLGELGPRLAKAHLL